MRLSSSYNDNSRRGSRWLLPLSAVTMAFCLVVFRIPYAHIEWGWLSYAWTVAAICSLGFIFLRRGGFKNVSFNIFLAGILVWSAVTIVVMTPPPYFRSWMRLAYFCMLLLVASPLINSPSLARFRRVIWIILWWILGIYSILSLVIHICQIAMEPMWYTYMLRGIYVSRMVNGLISAITAVAYSVPLIFGRVSRSAKVFAGIVFVICIYFVIISTSRIAGVAVFAGVLIVCSRAKVNYKWVLLWFVLAVVLLGCVVLLLGNGVTSLLLRKINFYTEESFLWSRVPLFDARIQEFLSNPIFGVGYASERIITGFDKFSDWVATGAIEPGSSWLALLSQTGIIGFLLMSVFVWTVIVKAYALMHNAVPVSGSFNFSPDEKIFYDQLNASSSLMCSPTTIVAVFTALIVESLVEGWILAGGAFFALVFWLSCSMIQNTRLVPAPDESI